ncbi:MAG: hypothetical protein JST65_08565, partial [Acidobacteria bacterium]|nr:hypothetical protein [Acidobacteriota bacterium]
MFEAEQVVVIDGQQVASPAPLTFNLDVNGNLAAMVPANNDPHIVPTGFAWSWKVTEQFVGGRPPYFINVDFATPPPGVNLATAVPVVPPIPYVTYLTRTDIDVLVPSVGAVNALQVKTIQHYGGVADGTTNIGPAIAAAIADGAKQLRFPAAPLPYKLTQSVDFSGMQLFGDGPGTVIDATTGTFSSNFVFAASGSLSSLPNLAADVSIGASSLLFVSAPALAPGDIFCLDPTTSWSGHRSYYNAGEWCEVVAVSGSTVYLKNPLYDNYTAASVTVFKQVSKVAGIRDVTINAAASLGVISASLCANPSFSNVVGTHYGDSIISFDRCVYPTVTECQLSNYGGQGNEYAVVFGNSQHG